MAPLLGDIVVREVITISEAGGESPQGMLRERRREWKQAEHRKNRIISD
jgi:hypothetical protein